MTTPPTSAPSRPSRRQFVKTAAVASAAVAAPTIVPSRVFGQDAPSNQITVGLIAGSQGSRETAQVLIGHGLEAGLQLVDAAHQLAIALEQALIPAAEHAGQEITCQVSQWWDGCAD